MHASIKLFISIRYVNFGFKAALTYICLLFVVPILNKANDCVSFCESRYKLVMLSFCCDLRYK